MTRLSVNINDETRADMLAIAQQHGLTVTEVVRRAVAVYELIHNETVVNGKRFQVVGPGKRVREVVIL